MSYQIIKQPNEKYMLWSTFIDSIVYWDATREDIIRFFVEKAKIAATQSTSSTLDMVDQNPRDAYYQFTMTFEQALARSHSKEAKKWFLENNILEEK